MKESGFILHQDWTGFLNQEVDVNLLPHCTS